MLRGGAQEADVEEDVVRAGPARDERDAYAAEQWEVKVKLNMVCLAAAQLCFRIIY